MAKSIVRLALFVLVPAAVACGDDGAGGWLAIPCADGMTGIDGPNGDLCIDSMETTNAEFAAYLTEHGNVCGGSQECMHVDEPGSHISQAGSTFEAAAGYESLPVVQVTFHGAAAYCAAASKFLCPDEAWVAACGGPDGEAYPYGSAYDGAACNGGDAGGSAPVAVGAFASCEGGAIDLFDMSGNVYEWTDACATAACLIRGGSFDVFSDDLTCDASHEMDGPSGHREDLGLRCCASPL
ncbi:MAG: formylglycine-generating enzyme family protein [Proteobacteria bacterium]|jgi:formylglycine-generating enzyme required for sulfatase activity|nr:formylglycine-generating enzyme family protein [Pseudomonadota bacterium]